MVKLKYNIISAIRNILLFLVNPMLVTIALFSNYKKLVNPKTLIVLISGFIGYSFIFSDTSDLAVYVNNFNAFDLSFDELITNIKGRYRGTVKGRLDVYLDFVIYFTKIFTQNHRVFIIILGLIFGCFYANYIDLFNKYIKGKGFVFLFFAASFTLAINPQLGINYRFFTASAIIVYSLLKILLEDKKIYFTLIVSSVFFHSGMLALILFAFLVYFLRNKPKFSIIVLIFSLVVSGLSFTNLSSLLSSYNILGGFVDKSVYYTSESAYNRYDDIYGSGGKWFFNLKAPMFFTSATLLLIYFYFMKIKTLNTLGVSFFVVAALSVAFWNLTNSFPMIYRYEPVFVVFVSAFFLFINSTIKINKLDKYIQLIGISFMMLYLVFTIRILLGSLPSHFPISNPIIETLFNSDSSLYDFLFKR